ncbi:MAG: TatD family hydrolase [Gammaproteobacteria bacterium]|nr:TatD family hydrolase [Gammaproteobacteria bacterium]
MVDIGANLSHNSFRKDLDQVTDAAKAAGVGHIIITGTDLESIESASNIAAHSEGYMSFTAGFHPHVASTFDDQAYQRVADYARSPQVVAVGEIGLDFNRNYSTPQQQEEAFTRQLQLACETGKPVFLHQRDAHDSFYSILKEYRPKLASGVVHCFTDTKEALYDYLDLDLYVGITGWICDERRGKALQELVIDIPPDRLLLETDAPYLLPRSLKPAPASRRNEPQHLVEVARRVALCTGRSVEEIAAQTTRNAQALFGLKKLH